MRFLVLSLVSALTCLIMVSASEDEERLMVDVFRGYNSLIQPVKNLSDTPTIVKMALQLVLLINVDEKDQIMHTNVWLTLQWHDFYMRWNPVDYGGIQELRVSPDKVWLPDIVLFNNADGNYEVSFMSNVIIGYKGNMLWVPPAIYKSSCIIDVEFFPFDEQTCHLIFGSWTYNENEIKLEFIKAELIDMEVYEPSAIWDVIDAPASLVKKRSRIEFQLRIRRKTLFYTVVLILPTVLMAFLSMAVFFLPMTLTISVLLSIVVFLLLVSKILPPTSSTIPLMAKYLLLTFTLNVITILVTVIIINVYHRSPTTHRMPDWVRAVFLKWMPRLLCMQRPLPFGAFHRPVPKAPKIVRDPKLRQGIMTLPGIGQFTQHTTTSAQHHPNCPVAEDTAPNCYPPSYLHHSPSNTQPYYPLTNSALQAIDAIEYITDHLRRQEEVKLCRNDWKYVAMVIDRLLLYIFFGITLGGTLGIVFSAPYVLHAVDQESQLEHLKRLYKSGGLE